MKARSEDADGVHDDEPLGWATVPLQSLATDPKAISYGVLKPGPFTEGGIPLLRVKDLIDGSISLREVYRITPDLARLYRRTKLSGGEVLLSIQGSVGRVAVVPPALAGANVSRTLAVIPPAIPELASWIWLALQAPEVQSAMRDAIGGTTRDSLNLRDVRLVSIPVPPLAEQERILAKVEKLLARVNGARERLARVPAVLKRFRKAVLAAACDGRLTDANPEEWREATLEEVGKWFTGGTPSRRVAINFGGGIPWVKSGELRDGLVTETSETLSRTGMANSAAKLMPKGTVSVALYGATIGKVGVLGMEATTNQACANCIVNDRVIDRWFLFYFLTQQRDQLVEAGQGGAQPNLTNQIVRSWPLRLPPIPEQREIVRRVVVLFKLADAIEKRVAAATARAEKLTQAILAKAFRGELVPTEAELARREGRAYEPAAALLERVKGQGAVAAGAGRRQAFRPKAR